MGELSKLAKITEFMEWSENANPNETTREPELFGTVPQRVHRHTSGAGSGGGRGSGCDENPGSGPHDRQGFRNRSASEAGLGR